MGFTFWLLLALALVLRAFFLPEAGHLIDLDEATFGLMAKRILEGELPIYISGHSYSGSFIAFLTAPFIALMGTHPMALKLPLLILFAFFLALNQAFLKKTATPPVAAFGTLFLAVMPRGMLDVSMRAWGGHAELWSFAAGFWLLVARFLDSNKGRGKASLLFASGLVAGTALWLSEMFLLYMAAFLLYAAWRTCPAPRGNFSRWLANLFWLRLPSLPPWFRYFSVMHLVIAVWLAANLLGMLGVENIPFATDPLFRMKELKKIALYLLGEVFLAVLLANSDGERRKDLLKKTGLVLTGFLLGHFPAILFNSMGGEGLRIFHRSGFLAGPDLTARIHDLFCRKIPSLILASPPPFDAGEIAFILLMTGIVLAAFLAFRKQANCCIQPFFFLALFTVAANALSTLEAERYLAPAYLAVANILGFFLGAVLWKRTRAGACLLAFVVAAYFLRSDWQFYREIPRGRLEGFKSVLEYVKEKGLHGGRAPRSLSHILTFLAGEEVVFAAYSQEERYLPHHRYAESLSRQAYVFETDDSAHELFKNDASLAGQILEKQEIGRYIVYIVAEKQPAPPARADENEPRPPAESGRSPQADVPYSLWKPKPHLRLYLNV
jgi:hypothetical protein